MCGRDRSWTAAASTSSPWHEGPAEAGERCQPLSHLGRSESSPNANFSVPDRFPQIIQLASELEFNLGSEPIVSCVTTGNPLPASDSVEMRKADGTMLKVLLLFWHLLLVPPLSPHTSPNLHFPQKHPFPHQSAPQLQASMGSQGAEPGG